MGGWSSIIYPQTREFWVGVFILASTMELNIGEKTSNQGHWIQRSRSAMAMAQVLALCAWPRIPDEKRAPSMLLELHMIPPFHVCTCQSLPRTMSFPSDERSINVKRGENFTGGVACALSLRKRVLLVVGNQNVEGRI